MWWAGTCSLSSTRRRRLSFCRSAACRVPSSPCSFSAISPSTFRMAMLFCCSYSRCFTFCLYTCTAPKCTANFIPS
eukprot:jgi/Botrbrau1/9505/Bobra.0252s0120.1